MEVVYYSIVYAFNKYSIEKFVRKCKNDKSLRCCGALEGQSCRLSPHGAPGSSVGEQRDEMLLVAVRFLLKAALKLAGGDWRSACGQDAGALPALLCEVRQDPSRARRFRHPGRASPAGRWGEGPASPGHTAPARPGWRALSGGTGLRRALPAPPAAAAQPRSRRENWRNLPQLTACFSF